MYLSPPIAGIVVQNRFREAGGNTEVHNVYTDLTSKEREVLQLIAEGNDSQDIAARLFITQKTVLAHRQKIMRKVGTYTTAGLIRYALRQGIASL